MKRISSVSEAAFHSIHTAAEQLTTLSSQDPSHVILKAAIPIISHVVTLLPYAILYPLQQFDNKSLISLFGDLDKISIAAKTINNLDHTNHDDATTFSTINNLAENNLYQFTHLINRPDKLITSTLSTYASTIRTINHNAHHLIAIDVPLEDANVFDFILEFIDVIDNDIIGFDEIKLFN